MRAWNGQMGIWPPGAGLPQIVDNDAQDSPDVLAFGVCTIPYANCNDAGGALVAFLSIDADQDERLYVRRRDSPGSP